MSLGVPSYASQFKYLNLSFPFKHVLHVVLNRSDTRSHTQPHPLIVVLTTGHPSMR